MLKYLNPFLIAFLLSILFTSLAVYFSKKMELRGRNSRRHIHKKNISRMGGMVMVLVFSFTVLINRDLFITMEIYGLLASSLILLVVGLWDDLREILWKIQLFFQVAVSVLIFVVGIRIYYITNPFTGGIFNMDTSWMVLASIFLVVFWILVIINSINWLDGIDGLSGGVTLISAATIFFLSLKSEVNQPPIAIICAIFLGTVLGFLVFNFYPAKIMAGTSGSMFMGFMLASLAIIAGTKIATAILVLAVPIIDFLWVIWERIRDGQSIFKSDSRHLHYKLLKIGWTKRKIVLSYCMVTATIAVVALNTRAIGKSITLFISVCIMLFAMAIINKKIQRSNI